MSRHITIIWLLLLNGLLAVGDLLAKKAVDEPARNLSLTFGALIIWIAACCMWLPLMRAKGFTRLIALADVIGLLMLAVVGYFFLGERLTTKEIVGVAFAVVSVLVLGW